MVLSPLRSGYALPTRREHHGDTNRQRLHLANPEICPNKPSHLSYRHQTADQKTVGLYNFAFAHKDLPDNTAYTITKTVLENNARLVKGHPAARETVAANATRNSFLPFHPGAVRYYMEKGVKLDPATLVK